MKTILLLKNMHCTGCENRVKNVLSSLKEVKDVKANYQTGEVMITSKKELNMEDIKEKLENLDFPVKEVRIENE